LKAWIIHNPHAGRFPAHPFVERAARVLQQRGWETVIHQTGGPQDIQRLAAACAREGCEALFVAGGDGTVGQAAKELAGTSTALGVLPAGTANVFAQELGLAGLGYTDWFALEESASRLASGHVAEMDLGRCNGQVFMLWAGVGLDGYIIGQVEPRPRTMKHLAVPYYVAASLWAVRGWQGLKLRVQVDQQLVSGQFAQIVVSNIQRYGGGLFHLAKDARADDGLLDVWLFEGESAQDALRHAVGLLRGSHVHHPHVMGLTARRIHLEAPEPVPWQLDGERYAPAKRFEIEVWPAALRVLLPQDLPQPLFSGATAKSHRSE